nr:asparaginase [Propionibacterium sp.]
MDAPVVARVVRNGVVESVHHGLGVVTDAAGAVLVAVGDPGTVVLPRSANKPLQAVGCLRAGAPARDETLAVAASSHSGEPFHLDAVRRLLAAGGLTEAALRNTPDYPVDEAARIAWIAAGRPRTPLAQNCSGKHAAMVTAAAASGWDVAAYLDPTHPLQRLLAATIEEFAGEPVAAVVVDGCGAPQHGLTLAGLARAFGRLASAPDGEAARVADAMRRFPEYVGGTGRDATGLMRAVPGLVAKDGAEGVFAVGLPDGRGVAVKIADGASRGRGVLLAGLLRRAGVGPDAALATLADEVVLGHGRPVGRVEGVRLG